MSDKSGIEWTEATWNPVTGCSKVSQGCKNCYALREWPRLAANPKATAYYGREFTDVRCHEERLDQPLRWQKPRRIFVNSMSDLFHEAVPDAFIVNVLNVMEQCGVRARDAGTKSHIFQVLTKRPERMRRLIPRWIDHCHARGIEPVIDHIWLGVSVEDQATADERIPLLLETPAAVRWLSMEPLLGPVDLDRGGWSLLKPRYAPPRPGFRPERIQWVVVGGESGPKARPMHPDWVRSLRDQCVAAEVPFFFKQWGEWTPTTRNTKKLGAIYHFPGGALMRRAGKKTAGRTLDGQTFDQYPEGGR